MLNYRIISVFLVFSLALASCSNKQSATADVVIVQVNDIYEIAGVNEGKEGNLARVQGLVDSLKKIYPKVLLVHAGDFLNPSLIGNLKDENGEKIKGKHMVEVMNAMRFDEVAFGNHEIDLNQQELQARLNEMQFDMIVSNLFFRDSTGTKPIYQQERKVQPYKRFNIETDYGKRKLVLLSVILPYNQKPYVQYNSVDSTLSSMVPRFKNDMQDVFLLTHLNRAHDNQIGKQLGNVNLIMGGHDHYSFCDTISGDRYITKADANARTAWIHYANWNDNSKEFVVQSELIVIDEKIKKNPSVQKVIDKWLAFAEKNTSAHGYDMSNALKSFDYPLDAREESIRSEQTDFGKLTCEAMQSVFDTADVVVLNSGSIRYDDLILSPVTEGDILKALPFGGGVFGAYMSGEDVLKMYEARKLNQGTGGYLQVLQKPESISEFGMYYVITSSYMSAGREKNLSFLGDKDWEAPMQLKDSTNDIRNILINYLKES